MADSDEKPKVNRDACHPQACAIQGTRNQKSDQGSDDLKLIANSRLSQAIQPQRG